MPLTDLLLTILATSLFCCGLTIATSEGMVLYFLRKPFNILQKKVEEWALVNYHNHKVENVLYLAKPLLLCTACMGSFWGIIIFGTLHGIDAAVRIIYIHIPFPDLLLPLPLISGKLIICCVCSCFVNAFMMTTYNRL